MMDKMDFLTSLIISPFSLYQYFSGSVNGLLFQLHKKPIYILISCN